MEVTEVRIKLMDDPHERLMAFCSITLDGSFVIRDLKLIQGKTGPFVAMPSRKLTDRCPRCHTKNHLRAAYCNQCGVQLLDERATKDEEGRARLYADIAHPINPMAREQIQAAVVAAYHRELVQAEQPGYTCNYDDLGEEQFAELEFVESEMTFAPFQMNGRNFRIDAPEQVDRSRATERPQATHISNSGNEHVYSGDEFGDGLL